MAEWNMRVHEVIDLIEMCEPSGMGGGMTSPSSLLEETNAYFLIRRIVMGEKGRIERYKQDKEDRKKDRTGR